MGKDTTTAAHHKSTNALNDIPDDLLGPIPAEIRLGSTVLMIAEKPPELGDTITVITRIRITREGKEKQSGEDEGEVRHFRAGKIVTAWKQGDPEPPDPDEDQPALIDENGQIPDDEDNEPGIVRPTDSGVAAPGFSDAGDN